MAKKKYKYTKLNVKTWDQDGKLIRDHDVDGPFPLVVKRAREMAKNNTDLQYQVATKDGKNCVNIKKRKIRKCRKSGKKWPDGIFD